MLNYKEGVCVCVKCFVTLETVSVEIPPQKHFGFVFVLILLILMLLSLENYIYITLNFFQGYVCVRFFSPPSEDCLSHRVWNLISGPSIRIYIQTSEII